jgi:hypothetical protein
MRTKYLLTTGIVAMVWLFIAAGIYAGTNVPNVIELKTTKYTKHKKKIVKFDHLKHQQDYQQKYPDFHKKSCG